MKKNPPKCPYCGKALTRVEIVKFAVWDLDLETGGFRESASRGEVEEFCGECGSDLPDDMFPGGIENYPTARTR